MEERRQREEVTLGDSAALLDLTESEVGKRVRTLQTVRAAMQGLSIVLERVHKVRTLHRVVCIDSNVCESLQ